MPQLIHRGMDICAHRRLNQVFPVITLTGLKQVFYGRANCIYDSAEIRRPAFRGLFQFFQGRQYRTAM